MTHKEGKGRERSPPFEVLKLLIISKLSEENKMENNNTYGYTYHFVDSNKEIEVSEYWLNVLGDLDKEEYNNDHAQFRDKRRYGLDLSDVQDKMTPDTFSFEEDLIGLLEYQRIMKYLTEKQQKIARVLMACDGNVEEAAKLYGIRRSSMRRQIERIKTTLSDVVDYKAGLMDASATGSNIKSLRKEKQYSVQEIVKALGCNQNRYYMWERGAKPIPRKYWEMLAEILQTDVSSLVIFEKI